MKIYSISCEADHISIRSEGATQIITNAAEFNSWVANVFGENDVLMCSSSMDFPEDETDDVELIALCRAIRR